VERVRKKTVKPQWTDHSNERHEIIECFVELERFNVCRFSANFFCILNPDFWIPILNPLDSIGPRC